MNSPLDEQQDTEALEKMLEKHQQNLEDIEYEAELISQEANKLYLDSQKEIASEKIKRLLD